MNDRFWADPSAIKFLGTTRQTETMQTIPILRDLCYEQHIEFPYYSDFGNPHPLDGEIKKCAIKIILERMSAADCVQAIRVAVSDILAAVRGRLLNVSDESDNLCEVYKLTYTHESNENKILVELKFVSNK